MFRARPVFSGIVKGVAAYQDIFKAETNNFWIDEFDDEKISIMHSRLYTINPFNQQSNRRPSGAGFDYHTGLKVITMSHNFKGQKFKFNGDGSITGKSSEVFLGIISNCPDPTVTGVDISNGYSTTSMAAQQIKINFKDA